MRKFLELSKKTREWGQKRLFNLLNSLNLYISLKLLRLHAVCSVIALSDYKRIGYGKI